MDVTTIIKSFEGKYLEDIETAWSKDGRQLRKHFDIFGIQTLLFLDC
jgi:hypothetical protein